VHGTILSKTTGAILLILPSPIQASSQSSLLIASARTGRPAWRVHLARVPEDRAERPPEGRVDLFRATKVQKKATFEDARRLANAMRSLWARLGALRLPNDWTYREVTHCSPASLMDLPGAQEEIHVRSSYALIRAGI